MTLTEAGNNKKNLPVRKVFFIRGKKVASKKLASNGHSGIDKKLNKITSIGFCNAIKGIKNGKVRIRKIA
jgi:hypothetical protein